MPRSEPRSTHAHVAYPTVQHGRLNMRDVLFFNETAKMVRGLLCRERVDTSIVVKVEEKTPDVTAVE